MLSNKYMHRSRFICVCVRQRKHKIMPQTKPNQIKLPEKRWMMCKHSENATARTYRGYRAQC